MLDIKWIRNNPQLLNDNLEKRGLDPIADEILRLDKKRREEIAQVQKLQNRRNQISEELSRLEDKESEEFKALSSEAKDINDDLYIIKNREPIMDHHKKLDDMLAKLPNLLDEEVQFGEDEKANKFLKAFSANVKGEISHEDIGINLGMLDLEHTSTICGKKFVTLTRDLAKLERALASFMLDIHTKEFGFVEVAAPYIVKDTGMYNTGHLPKFADDSFQIVGGYRLIPTSEVTLTNVAHNTVFSYKELPIRMVSFSHCFRSEAGGARKDSKALVRMRQFSKVELVSITDAESSVKEFEYLLTCSEEILKRLNLPHRVVRLCSGEVGFSASKTYDLEVWMPSQNQYREISSCSNCKDFQARRMNGKYKGQNGETQFVHTLNSSGVAISRTIAAILENYYNEDGSVTIPSALVDYMGGITKIEKVEVGSSII